MSKHTLAIILGFVVAVMPLLGFPGAWETAILIILGATISVLVFMMRQELQHGTSSREVERARDVYVENGVRSTAHDQVPSSGGDTHGKEAA